MQKRLEVGQIVNTFGIKGEVKVNPFTDDISRFDDLEKVYVKTRKESKLYKVENVRYHKNMVLLKELIQKLNNRVENILVMMIFLKFKVQTWHIFLALLLQMVIFLQRKTVYQ